MPALRQSVQKAILDACAEETLTAAHVKEILKWTLSAVRQTKRIVESPSEVQSVWEPSSWDSLSQTLAESEHLKSSTGLQTLCRQIIQVANQDTNNKSKASTKRKADEIEGGDAAESSTKAKRKAKKTKA